MNNFKSFLTVGICLSAAVIFTACASNQQKATKQAYSQGKSEYFAQNYDSSFQQIQQAAQAGDPDAQYALGYMYYYGKGTPQDSNQALSWIRKAAAQGQTQAIKALELISKQSAPQMASAQTSANNNAKNAQPTGAENFTLAGANQNSTSATTPTAVAANSMPSSMKAQKSPKHAHAKIASSAHSNKLVSSHEGYTVQLLGAYNRNDIIKFMNQHNLNAKAAFYKSTFNNKDWYVLVYGHYSTIAEAKKAIAQLPADLQKQNPWVKSLSSVQAAIAQNQQST